MEEDINLLDYLNVVFRRKYFIITVTLLFMLLMGAPKAMKKDVYEAKANLLLKESELGQSQFASFLGIKTSKDNNSFCEVISSRAVAGMVLDDLKLVQRIEGWDSPDAKRQELVSSVQDMPEFSGQPLFEIKVLSEDPGLAADVANAFADAGSRYWRKMNYSEARKKREYIEGQLPRVESDLRKAEEALKKFSLISPDITALNGVQFKRLEREFEIQNTTYTMLRKEYETAKLEESKELEPFTMIDKAEVPLKPLKKKLLLNFAIGMVFGLFSSTSLAFLMEYLNKLR